LRNVICVYVYIVKTIVARCFIVLILLSSVGVVLAGQFKSKTITNQALVITVPDGHFLKITNFTQEGGTDRGLVQVTLQGDSSDSTGTADVLTATRIDLSTGTNSQNFPEIDNRAVIAGPAQVTVSPVVGGTLFITYRKDSNEGAGGGVTPTPIFVSPTPGVTATPTATATATATP
jgi:hypothetical protein